MNGHELKAHPEDMLLDQQVPSTEFLLFKPVALPLCLIK